jgi:hypothetical protein
MNVTENSLSSAQADMRLAYCGGAAGMLASALAWFSAAIVSASGSPTHGVWTLLIAGMFIHPAGMLIAKLLGRPGNHSKGNPLGTLAGASTFWLVFCLPLAYALSLQKIEWFFPAMLLMIGGRYLVFHTLYGLRIYWFCGMALAACGIVLGILLVRPAISAAVGATIEAAFGISIFLIDRKK